MLPRRRVIYQAPDERNYHIFYQLCTQANQPEMKSLALCKFPSHRSSPADCSSFELVPPNQFRYTSEGNAITIKGVNDAQQFLETREALALLGLSLLFLSWF
jgi:myosin-5